LVPPQCSNRMAQATENHQLEPMVTNSGRSRGTVRLILEEECANLVIFLRCVICGTAEGALVMPPCFATLWYWLSTPQSLPGIGDDLPSKENMAWCRRPPCVINNNMQWSHLQVLMFCYPDHKWDY
jgi:hypothetical protein